jgi:type II secretory pathway predicted ATPase ExeA
MGQPKSAATPSVPYTPGLEIDDLTRDQRTILGRITNRFRESAVVQVLSGAHESGKSTVAELVGHCLAQEAVTVTITKQGDQTPGQKRLMQEAYGSYAYLLAAVLKQIGFYARGEETDLVEQMVERLRALRQEDKRLLIILDDAQDITPGVWKRLQSWLDFQDRGVRMIQVLLVGSPMLRKMMGEPILRGWRRWVHGTYEIKLLKWSRATDEARRALKRACDVINQKAQPGQPITPPRISWFAIHKITHEAAGRPGRLNELIKRTLSASIRQGGATITRRFLMHADALRSPAMQPHKFRKVAKAAEKAPAEAADAGNEAKPTRMPGVAPDWMRYALGGLMVVFVLGAAWGISSWLSVAKKSASNGEVASVNSTLDLPEMQVESPTGSSIAGTQEVESPGGLPSVTSSVDKVIQGEMAPPSPAQPGDDLWSPVVEVAKAKTFSASVEKELSSHSAMAPSAPQTGAPADPEVRHIGTGEIIDLPVQTAEGAEISDLKDPVLIPSTAKHEKKDSLIPMVPEVQKNAIVSVPKDRPERGLVESPAKPSLSTEKEASHKPRLRKKTLEALSRLEKNLK